MSTSAAPVPIAIAPVELGTADDLKSAKESATRPSLVIYSAKWCGVCKTVVPRVVELVRQIASSRVLVCTADVDALGSAVTVTGVPTVELYMGGRPIYSGTGAAILQDDGAALRAALEEATPVPKARIAKIDEGLLIGGQPSREQLKHLNLLGVRSVLSMGHPTDAYFLPNERELLPADLALDYAPIHSTNELSEDNYIDLCLEKIRTLPAPVLIHCKP